MKYTHFLTLKKSLLIVGTVVTVLGVAGLARKTMSRRKGGLWALVGGIFAGLSYALGTDYLQIRLLGLK